MADTAGKSHVRVLIQNGFEELRQKSKPLIRTHPGAPRPGVEEDVGDVEECLEGSRGQARDEADAGEQVHRQRTLPAVEVGSGPWRRAGEVRGRA